MWKFLFINEVFTAIDIFVAQSFYMCMLQVKFVLRLRIFNKG